MYEGDLIILPTDTVYGLAAKLYDVKALEKIYKIKGKKQSKQIPVLISQVDQLKDICVMSKFATELMKKYWNGALTMVLKTKHEYFEKTKEETLAVRMPKHPVALKLLDTYGPLKVTSLTDLDGKPIESIRMIEKNFKDKVKDIYPQGHIPKSDISSTVIDLTSRSIKLIRKGEITLDEIETFKDSLKR